MRQTSPARPHAPRRAARLALAALRACAVVTVVDVLLVGAKYEDRIVVVTHGSPDVLVLWWLYGLVELVVPMRIALAVSAGVWALTVAATVVAFAGWLVLARRNADRLDGRPGRAPGRPITRRPVPVGDLVFAVRTMRELDGARGSGPGSAPVARWWAALLVTGLLTAVGAFWRTNVVSYRISVELMVATHIPAYLLWATAAAAVWYTTALGRRVVRRITEAQDDRARAAPDRP